MLEFCSPVEPYPRAGELQQWFLEHETKIMAYLQTVITLLAGAVAKWVIQGDLSCIYEYIRELHSKVFHPNSDLFRVDQTSSYFLEFLEEKEFNNSYVHV